MIELKCSLCHKKLTNEYFKYGRSFIVCKRCNKELPKCHRCGLPTKNYKSYGETILCPTCQRITKFCFVCHKPITSKYYFYSQNSSYVCEKCEKNIEFCDFCAAPIQSNSHRYPDGRMACRICFRSAVSSEQKAREILNQIIPFLNNRFKMAVKHFLDVKLIDAKEIARRLGREFVPSKEYDPRHSGFFQLHNNKLTIFLERGLPEPMITGTIAHEFAHAWQSENLVSQIDARYLEGFAEWIAYKTQLKWGYTEEARHIQTRKDVYGVGFKKILSIEQKKGELGVFSELLRRYGK